MICIRILYPDIYTHTVDQVLDTAVYTLGILSIKSNDTLNGTFRNYFCMSKIDELLIGVYIHVR